MVKWIAVILVTAMLAGCSDLDKRKFTDLSTTPADSRLATAIWLHSTCPAASDKEVAAAAAPLIAAGISLAASYAVKTIEKSIEEYKKGLSGSFSASGTAVNGKALKCIVIARGWLGGTPKNLKAQLKKDSNDKLLNIYPKLGFSDYPVFYLELENVSDKADSVVLKPVYLSYADSAARNSGSGTKHVTAVIGFSQSAGKKADEIDEQKAFAVFRHDFGRLEIGKRYEGDTLAGSAASALMKNEQVGQPFNITAIISDTEDPSVAFQTVSETFASKKSDLEKAIVDALSKAIGVGSGKEGKP